jgi:hypothetical protein
MTRRSVVGLLLLAAVIAVALFWRRESAPTALRVADRDPSASTPLPSAPAIVATAPQPPPPAPPDDAVQPAAPVAPAAILPVAAEEARRAVEAELDNVQFALRDFRTALKENPVGSNAEITKALLGDNLKQVKMPIPAGSSVNGEGELCDRWGTPYFFHQLSGKEMEVRSAGPDRKMWTADDRQVK